LAQVARGGGYTVTTIYSNWIGNARWARNQISTSGEVRNDYVKVLRNLNGAQNEWVLINDTSDAALVAAARRAERIARLDPERPESELIGRWANEPAPEPKLFFDTTYNLDAKQRAEAAVTLARTAAEAGMLSAGYIQVAAHAIALIDTFGRTRYCAYTTGQVSVTVRTPDNSGSGWAGVDWPDWTKIDGAALAARALDKCLTSRNPVRVEPGRYTTILEPQAVCDFVSSMMQWSGTFTNPDRKDGPFYNKVGKRVLDPRLTIAADPLDPELGFPPFNPLLGRNLPYDWFWYDVYHPVTWIRDGIFQQFGWVRGDMRDGAYKDTHLRQAGGYRMSVAGATTTVEDMIATTKRGLLVTRFHALRMLDQRILLQRGYTRDGLWLIENGKISKSVKNLVFTESPLFALNNIEQLGVPQRTFHPKSDEALVFLPRPVIVPPMKIRDFSFTALTDAV
jgi:predicted Zn-dependent protease